MDLLSSTNRVKRETGDTIVLELDSEKSTNDITVLRVYIIDSESGDLNIEATAELYDAIVSNNQMFKTQIKRETDIVSSLAISYVLSHKALFICAKFCRMSWMNSFYEVRWLGIH